MAGSFTNLGPLSTTFTPAESCSVVASTTDSAIKYNPAPAHGNVCATSAKVLVPDPACYPSGLPALWTPFIHPVPYYSPASICPSGFHANYSVPRPAQTPYINSFADEAIQEQLSKGETFVGCCPQSYQWNLDSCANRYTPGQTITYVAYSSGCQSQTITTVVPSTDIPGPIFATAVNLVIPTGATLQAAAPEPTTSKTGLGDSGDDGGGKSASAGSTSSSGGGHKNGSNGGGSRLSAAAKIVTGLVVTAAILLV